ncbi:hypothetical protein ACIP1G_26725 [Pseudomonas sp. NPDC089392]|uniref:hypothetical protein n=1 Tax=Pseudomonas sp. NPDC089392 TaxID=3364459 RepID=UPI003804243E
MKGELNPPWAANIGCLLETANRHWALYYDRHCRSSRDNEAVIGVRDQTQEVKEYYRLSFGPCKLTYAPDLTKLTFTRLLVKQNTIITKKQGTYAPSIIKVGEAAVTNNQVLTVETSLTNSHAKLSKSENNELRWHWQTAPDVRFTGDSTYQPELKKHYDQTMSTLVCQIPWSQKLDLWIYPQKGWLPHVMWHAFTQQQKQGFTADRPQEIDTDLTISLSNKAFPEVSQGKVPADIQFFPGLCLAPDGWHFANSAPLSSDVVMAAFKSTY